MRARWSREPDPRLTSAQRELDRLAWLLDSSIRMPGGFRIGLDGLIGLIPGVGDAFGALASLYIVSRASALGLPKSVLARMVMNVALEGLIGLIPVAGDVFDFAYKANMRNVALLRRHAADAAGARRTSRFVIAAVAAVLVLVLAVIVALGIALSRWLIAAVHAA